MPDRAEESFVSLEKGDVTVGDRGIFKFLQRVTLLFFFAKKKKRSKKRKALAYPYSNRQRITRLAVFSQLYQQNGFSVGYRTLSKIVSEKQFPKVVITHRLNGKMRLGSRLQNIGNKGEN